MLLKDDPIWTDLKSDVLKIDELLRKAHQESVTGFIEFNFPDFSAAILLNEGEIHQCTKIKEGRAFPIGKSEILKNLEKMKANVGFYRLEKEILSIICRIINSDPVFENMSSQYVDIKQLLLSLEKDDFTGVVAVHSEIEHCFIQLENGSPAHCICKRMKEVVESIDCLERFLNSHNTMVVSVYKEGRKPDVVATLKKVTGEVLGEPVEKIEKMLEDSGTSRKELLKTVEEIEKLTYLFLSKKKAKELSKKLKETIEEVIT